MHDLLYQLIEQSARKHGKRPALAFKKHCLTYEELWEDVQSVAKGFIALHLQKLDRVAVYLEKRIETVTSIFGAAMAGGVFVPLNPLLRPRQVTHILKDCSARFLITTPERYRYLEEELLTCSDLRLVILVDSDRSGARPEGPGVIAWDELTSRGTSGMYKPHQVIDTDMASLLYTSGSTGMPKGVVLSQRNMVAGAKSVSQYLENNEEDRILAVLSLGFDAGFSQLTTGFNVGAKVVLIDFLMPRDVVSVCAEERITGLTAVPPLWIQLSQQEWPAEAANSMRYIANTGGHMPRTTLNVLRGIMPQAKPYLMYGLTEAFRSTYLDPAEVDTRVDSIGKAIPNAEIMVVREDGETCQPGEHGELVHRGALVALGYWNDPDRTAQRFRPAPGQPTGIPIPEMAVWSGDVVRTDEDGFIYFVGRGDDMIKTSGYRVSPTEVEDVVYATKLVGEAVTIGVPHPVLGQGIVVVAVGPGGGALDADALMHECRHQLPLYMVPQRIVTRDALPRTPNGKIDRKSLVADLHDLFQDAAS